jgi:hypothetical protein
MSDPIKAFLQNSGLQQPNFTANSRYAGQETAEWKRADGQTVLFVKRRFVPPPESFATLQEYRVEENDRLDNIAASFYSDPELYWRLCDANGAMNPPELVSRPGRRLRITLPEGIPEPGDES